MYVSLSNVGTGDLHFFLSQSSLSVSELLFSPSVFFICNFSVLRHSFSNKNVKHWINELDEVFSLLSAPVCFEFKISLGMQN